MFTASFDLSSFRRQAKLTVENLETDTFRAVRIAAQEGAEAARSSTNFKDRTGNLRAGIVARFLTSNGKSAQWQILSGAVYSKFVEEGTQAHLIRPKAQNGYSGPTRRGQTRRKDNDVGVGRGHALRWVSGGTTFFAKVVHHPGTQPHVFMGIGYQRAEAALYRELNVGVHNAARLWS